jgi:hypothetical protein
LELIRGNKVNISAEYNCTTDRVKIFCDTELIATIWISDENNLPHTLYLRNYSLSIDEVALFKDIGVSSFSNKLRFEEIQSQ